MTVSFGFYNSVNEDRKYNATQLSTLFDGIIRDGVLPSVEDSMMVTPGNGLNVVVGKGRAWFNHTWTLNDTPLVLSISNPDNLLHRIDSVILEVNSADDTRANTIKIVSGDYNSNPVKKPLEHTLTKHQYPLAYVRVNAQAVEILQDNIENAVGSLDCPLCTGALSQVTTDELLLQWDAQFGTWFNDVKGQLSTDPAGNLQNQINDIEAIDDSLQNQINTIQIDGPHIVWDSIKQEHLTKGASKVTNRQGASANNWNTPGSNNYAVPYAGIQVGAAYTIGGQGMVTVTFPEAFLEEPVVVVTPQITFGSGWHVATITSVTKTSFTVALAYFQLVAPIIQKSNDLIPINWMAIGKMA